MSLVSFLRGITETIFQIGKNGPQLKNVGNTALETRDAADGAFLVHRGLDPLIDDDFVTLRHFNANNDAATGITRVAMPLALATKISTDIIPDNALIVNVTIEIDIAYDSGTLWNIQRTGDGTVNPMTTAQNDPETINEYEVQQVTSWGSTGAGTVTATITGTPAAGAATLYLDYVTPNDIS